MGKKFFDRKGDDVGSHTSVKPAEQPVQSHNIKISETREGVQYSKYAKNVNFKLSIAEKYNISSETNVKFHQTYDDSYLLYDTKKQKIMGISGTFKQKIEWHLKNL